MQNLENITKGTVIQAELKNEIKLTRRNRNQWKHPRHVGKHRQGSVVGISMEEDMTKQRSMRMKKLRECLHHRGSIDHVKVSKVSSV